MPDALERFFLERHVDQGEQPIEDHAVQRVVGRVDPIETVVVFGIEDRVTMRIGLSRGMIVRADHFVARDFDRVPRDLLLQLLNDAQVHVVVLAAPAPVHGGIAVGADEVRQAERRHPTEQSRVEQFVIELIHAH